MAAAVRLGVPLSVARGARLPGQAWSPRDWALAQAVEMLDRSRCGRCGQPTWLSHDKANRKAFKVKAERCHSCNAMDEHPLVRSEDVLNPNAIRFSTEYVGEF